MTTTRRWRALLGEGGFTLTELLVAMSIMGIVLGGLFLVQQQGQWAYMAGAARVETQQNARLTLARFVDEVRISSGITNSPNCNNVANGGTSISFAWTNPLTAVAETVTYQLTGTNLQRTDANGTQTLIGGVQTLNIWCYQSDGTLTATPTNVVSVSMKITAQDETVDSVKQHAVVQSQVRLRNL